MTASAAKSPAILEVPLSELVPSPFNARKHFDREQLAELAGSIRSEGILQPLIVRNIDGRYQIISGERRFRAAKLADLDRVPCIVRDGDNEAKARRIQIIENLQREGIAPLEEAQSFQDLLKAQGKTVTHVSAVNDTLGKQEILLQPGPTVEAIAKELGKSKEYVYGRLKLLKLGEAAKKALEAGKIEAGHAVELVPLDEKKQEKALAYISMQAGYGNPVSVKDLREEIKYSINPAPKPKPSAVDEAREKKFREQRAKADAEWKRQEAARRRQSERNRRIQNAALTALWPQLRKWDPADLTRILIREEVDHIEGIGEAQLLAAGKPLPDNTITHANEKALLARPLPEQLALMVMAIAISRADYYPSGNADLFKRAKINTKKIGAQLAAEEKAKAKAALQTSAKPARKPKAKGKKRAAKPRKKGKK